MYNIALRSLFWSMSTFEFSSFTTTHKAILISSRYIISYLMDEQEAFQYLFAIGSLPIFAGAIIYSEDSCDVSFSLPLKHIRIQSLALFKTIILPINNKFQAVLKVKELDHITKYALVLAASLYSILFSPTPHYLDIFSLFFHTSNIINKIWS